MMSKSLYLGDHGPPPVTIRVFAAVVDKWSDGARYDVD